MRGYGTSWKSKAWRSISGFAPPSSDELICPCHLINCIQNQTEPKVPKSTKSTTFCHHINCTIGGQGKVCVIVWINLRWKDCRLAAASNAHIPICSRLTFLRSVFCICLKKKQPKMQMQKSVLSWAINHICFRLFPIIILLISSPGVSSTKYAGYSKVTVRPYCPVKFQSWVRPKALALSISHSSRPGSNSCLITGAEHSKPKDKSWDWLSPDQTLKSPESSN